MRKQKFNELNELIAKNDKIIDKTLLKKYFKYDSLGDMEADLYMTKDIHSNKTKANLIKNKLDSFKKNVISNMAMGEIDTKKIHKVVNTVSNILDFNEQYQQ